MRVAVTFSMDSRSLHRRCRAGFISSPRRSAICGDITLRALEALAAADLIACEDTRVTPQALDHYGIATPADALSRPQCRRGAAEAARAPGGRAHAVALVSDAGTPLISDPGYKLVRAAHRGRPRASPRCPGASARAGGADGRRPADRPLLFRGLPAAKGGGAAHPHRRARRHSRDAGPVRERRRGSPPRWPTLPPVSGRARPRCAAN